MTAPLRASISLDGKLLGASGKPLRHGIPNSRLEEARELELTIHPLILGDETFPSISGLPGAFLPEELRWDLLSAVKGREGKIVVRYRRKRFRVRPV